MNYTHKGIRMSLVKITFPEERLVPESEVITWARDAVTNGYVDASEFNETLKSAIIILKKLDRIKFAKTLVDDARLFITWQCVTCPEEHDCSVTSIQNQGIPTCNHCNLPMQYKETYTIED